MVDPRGSARPVGSGAEHPFLTALLERVLVFDGAFGTWMQGHDLGPDDFGGEVLDGWIAGGTDVLLIETVYDLLQGKAAINGARAAMRAAGVLLPIMVQVTVETTGRMLVGSEIGAALTALEAMQPDVIGMNCATGP